MRADARFTTKGFETASGGREQVISVRVEGGGDFALQQAAVAGAYREAMEAAGLPPGSAVFRRIFLSDVLNQAAALKGGGLCPGEEEEPVAVSVVEQAPLPGSKIALLAYHVTDPAGLSKRRVGARHVLVEKSGARHLWSTRLCAGAESFPVSAEAQTRAVFEELIGALGAAGGSLAGNCVRTWMFVKGIDVFYPGMVASRRALFAEQGLTEDTHYIAATGIQGACAHRFDVVAMDAYSQLDLVPGQIAYLNDFDRLCPTHRYGVTFERGSSVSYADRRQYFISGTASIDGAGQVVHRGDVLAQLERALGNVEALLGAGSGRLDDLLYLIVYLRDRADAAAIEAAVAERLPGLPVVFVEGVVCRPEWLVEIEGVGVAALGRAGLAHF
ncbi:MAG: RidA family protein [Rhodospirillales bacterium]|nr:RidA family protein [Rhodospirillales bacterium]